MTGLMMEKIDGKVRRGRFWIRLCEKLMRWLTFIQFDGVIQGGALAAPHIPIDPTTITPTDY
jgi:hypothetical protein